MTARGNEISFAKMPLMRIRSVEIVFEDEMSACTDTALLDRSIELIISDSDDSTKCVDDLEHLQVEGDDENDSITLNAEGELSEDNSVSLPKDTPSEEVETKSQPSCQDSTQAPSDSVTSAIEDTELSLTEIVDSGRFTEDASSSHLETVPLLAYEDALLSQSFDAIAVDKSAFSISLVTEESSEGFAGKIAPTDRLYEYIDSDSSDSDHTAVCDADPSSDALGQLTPLLDPNSPDDHTLCDSSDLQYDSFIDMGKF